MSTTYIPGDIVGYTYHIVTSKNIITEYYPDYPEKTTAEQINNIQNLWIGGATQTAAWRIKSLKQ